MKKKEIEAIELLQKEIKYLKKERDSKDERIRLLSDRCKELTAKNSYLNETVKDEVTRLRAETNELREMKERLHDFDISEKGTPTIYTGFAYVVSKIDELKQEITKRKK